MVKKKAGAAKLRGRAERHLKATKAEFTFGDDASTNPSTAGDSGPALPSHFQKKLARKVRFLDRVAASRDATLGPRNPIKKKRGRRREGVGALANLGALADSLAEATGKDGAKSAMPRKGLSVGGTRKRLKIVQKETARLHKVCQDPMFRKDPLAAITGHLTATLPPPPETPTPKAQPSGSHAPLTKAERRQREATRKFMQRLDAAMTD